MAFPQVHGVTQADWINDATPQVTLPGSIPEGSKLIVFCGDPRGTDDAWGVGSSGTTKIAEGDVGNDATVAIFTKDVGPGDSGATLTFAYGNEFGDDTCLQAYVITGAGDLFFSSSAGGTSGNPNPPSLNPGAGAQDYLWIAVAMQEDGNLQSFGAPANFSNLVQTNGDDACGLVTARRELNASSLDPGTFSNGSGQSWVAFTVAIEPGEVSTVHELSGTVTGQASLEGALTPRRALTGTALAASQLEGSLTRVRDLAGAVSGNGTLDGSLTRRVALEGEVSGTTTFLGSLVGATVELVGQVVGSAAFSGTLSRIRSLAGTVVGQVVLRLTTPPAPTISRMDYRSVLRFGRHPSRRR